VIRAVLFFFLFIAAPAHADSTLAQVVAKKILRVGMQAGVSPFVAAGAECDELRRIVGEKAPPARPTRDGRSVCGIDVELAAEAARALGVTLEIELTARFDELLPGLRAGRYDVAIAAITRTLDRAVTVAFTEPYFASGLEVRVRDTARFPTLESLKQPGVKIGFERATTAESFARGELTGATLVPLAGEAELLAAIDDPARADAVVIDYVNARDLEVRQRVHATLSAVEQRRFTSESLAMAVRQGDPDWLGWLDLFLKQEKSSGAFHKLAARFNPWFRTER
jgi:polar amino acid transport system substrate-binding protein